MATIFSKIVAGEIPSYKCAENERFYAFLDINPLVKGHTLVVATAIKKAFPCIKVGQAVLGLEVPHAHIHLIPMQSEKDMLFSNPKLSFTDEEFQAIAKAIRDNFEDKEA